MSERTDSGNLICSNCGTKLKPGTKFCNTCGLKVTPAVPVLRCPNCGETLNENTKFCRHCGAELKPAIKETGTPVSPQPVRSEETKKENSRPLIWVMAGIIGVLAIVIAFLLGRGSADKPADTAVQETPKVNQSEIDDGSESITRLDLTYALENIDELQRILPMEGGMESEDYAHWWYSGNGEYSCGSYTGSSKADYFRTSCLGHSYYGITIGEPLSTAGLAGWDQIGSNYDNMTYRLDNLVLTVSYDTDDGNNTVTAFEFFRERDNASTSEEDDDYFFPDSLNTLLDESQLYGMSAQELTYARNEIYARYGYTFQRQDLQEYFNTKSWYHADPKVNKDTISSYVSKIGMQNMVMIRDYQKAHGLTY